MRDYFVRADRTKIRCVDERHADDQTNGVQIQGGTTGIVDALKQTLHITEDEAWDRITRSGIPLGGHGDDHHGDNGCGYNNGVATNPGAFGVKEMVPTAERLGRIRQAKGEILTYTGGHEPVRAMINYHRGITLDTNRAFSDHQGTFNLDIWVADEYAKKLGLTQKDTAAFKNNLLHAYMETVKTLTQKLPQGQINTFTILH